MRNMEKIFRELEANNKLCDDCLSMKCEITPRQTVNRLCRETDARGEIRRAKGACDICNKIKLVNSAIERDI